MAIQKHSYDGILESYEATLRWLDTLGVKIEPGRTKHYREVLEYWTENYRSATKWDAQKIFPDFVSAIFEVMAFIEIYESFKDVPIKDLAGITTKLNKGVSGPLNSADENANTSNARNFIFEALVAAKCHRPLKNVFAILDAESDTGFTLQDKKIWVECKRVTSPKKLEANIRKACNQLEIVLARNFGSDDRGMVAIDVSKLINPKDELYVQITDHELIRSIGIMMDNFIRDNFRVWEKVYSTKSKKILGLILRFSFMATSEKSNLIVHVAEWAVNPRLGLADSEQTFLQRLVEIIGSQEQT
ncbi:MAG: hypothetical protein HYS18_13790 [Burkholderiales bacterium]|nr:hypothetical protein [Burkholderiales bacterium]